MPESSISKRFGAVVRTLRTRSGISQEALAERAGLHATYISMVERGTRNPTLDAAHRIALAFNRRLAHLIEECEAITSEP